MVWEAANIPRPEPRRLPQDDDRTDATRSTRNVAASRRNAETVEAAIARLTKAYSVAMTCIGALQKASDALVTAANNHDNNNNNNPTTTTTEEQRQQVVQVANAARSTLENAILMDPLVVQHARLTRETFQHYHDHSAVSTNVKTLTTTTTTTTSTIDCAGKEQHQPDDNCDNKNNESTEKPQQQHRSWAFVMDPRPTPPSVSSAAHQSSIRDMAYAALVNYADLLWSACACDSNCHRTWHYQTLPHLGILNQPGLDDDYDDHNDDRMQTPPRFSCCWQQESAKDTQRLAMVALCDASELDGSDPTLWLKLAFVARALGSHTDGDSGCSHNGEPIVVGERKYRRLERHALEQGFLALPPHLPPNRIIVRALEEFQKEPEPTEYPAVLATVPETVELILELPRYSWSRLGRMLIKACREGTEYSSSQSTGESSKPAYDAPASFGSPLVALHLSPMLVLPSRVLGAICQYLENESIWKFEATCRALSVAIIAARVDLERGAGKATTSDKNVALPATIPQADVNDVVAPIEHAMPVERLVSEGTVVSATATTTRRGGGSSGAEQAASRTSKRLRSQQITSGKLAEKSSRRRSVEYCFLSATLSCTSDDPEYIAILQQGLTPWLPPNDGDAVATNSTQVGFQQPTQGTLNEKLGRQQVEARERVADASLSAFVSRWSRRNSGPMDLLSRFLVHMALYVEDVFASDPGGVMALSTCFLDCLDVMSRRSGSFDALAQFPFDSQNNIAGQQRLEAFAVNLLAAELKLRRCERGALENMAEHTDSLGSISYTISELMRALPVLDDLFADAIHWVGLKARTYWLAAGFNFLISHGCPTVASSREAEQEGFRCIDEILKCLELPSSRPLKILKTIHLESPSRLGPHWSALSKESLTSFRDDLQASSVVSLAREKFLMTLTSFESVHDGTNEPNFGSMRSSLESIGEALKSRYDLSKQDSEANLVELLDDFISLHSVALSSAPSSSTSNDLPTLTSRWSELWGMIMPDLSKPPFLPGASVPSIVSIFLATYSIQSKGRLLALRLLGHLVAVAYNYQKSLLPHRSSTHDTDTDQLGGEGDSDDFSDGDSSVGYSTDDQSASGQIHRGSRSAQLSKPKLCIRIMQLFTEKMAEISHRDLDDSDVHEFARSDDCQATIRCCLLVCAEWYQPSDQSSGDLLDIEMFSSIKLMVQSLGLRLDRDSKERMDRLYFRGLSRLVVAQRKAFTNTLPYRKGGRAARSAHQRRCKTRAEFVASVSVEAASLLSGSLARIHEGSLVPSDLFTGTDSDNESGSCRTNELTLLCASWLWFWKYVIGFDTVDDKRLQPALGGRSEARTGNSFDRPIVDELRVPIATSLIALSGAACRTRLQRELDGNQEVRVTESSTSVILCLSEFFDTDASANELSSDDEGDDRDVPKSGTNQSELLRILCHSVHSVSLVFENVTDKESVALVHASGRPLLPLVVARVLNNFADILLSHFGPNKGQNGAIKNLFELEYPFRARAIGRVLDDSLYKAYKCLHGFTLLSTQSTIANDDNAAKKCSPESISAAAQLYRCIQRAYGSGRRSPPRAALECVALALPPLPITDKSKAIRDFLFSANESYFGPDEIIAIVREETNWESRFAPIMDFLTSSLDTDDEVDELFMVQRGVCHQLAELPLPPSSSDTDAKGPDDERATSTRTEDELMKKINAILDDLCSGDCLDYDGWHRAAQCALMKADLIADRLGLSKGFSRNKNFRIPENRLPSSPKVTLSRLVTEQEQEFHLQQTGWIPCLGSNLSVYVQKLWCSFSSLESCAAVVGDEVRRTPVNQESDADDQMAAFAVQVWKEIEWLKEKEDYVLWQQAWGSLFVAALRKITFRCECLALYSLFKQSVNMSDKSTRVSEIYESLGIALYSELMGSQGFGYPLRILTDHEKRKLAEAAQICFRSASDSISASDDADESRLGWDLLFMVGKCYEKIAGTYRQEAFRLVEPTEDTPRRVRRYEFYMALALESYASSLKEARSLEDEKDFILEQAGGSAHGAKEVFYRLHASRLKCLISAVTQPESELQEAENEALVLTEKSSFLEPSNDPGDGKTVRDRVWDVFSDVVAALASCRLEQPFFHRSVFRHAQALMWAPVLDDPVLGRVEGSLGTVPISKGYRIRGLNSGTSVANSAQVIMASLFEKKRSHLCAVWVTTANVPSPFQALNSSARKYDALRGKYVSAYIESLQLSQNLTQLEVLLQWAISCRRDLPSYFQASAAAKGLPPEHPHTRDSLLVKGRSLALHGFLRTVKRQANSAIASIVLQELSSRPNQDAKASETRMKTAYACFLRLNCTVEELERSNAWRYGKVPEAEAVCQAYLALAGSKVDVDENTSSANDWSGGARKSTVLKKALAKFRELFPSVNGNFYTKKAVSKPRKTKSIDSSDKLPSPSRQMVSGKRKEAPEHHQPGEEQPVAASRRMSFTVSVPQDLKTGDRFHTTVKLGEQYKKVTLTVPSGSPQTLKFSLDIPAASQTTNEEPATKRMKETTPPSSP